MKLNSDSMTSTVDTVFSPNSGVQVTDSRYRFEMRVDRDSYSVHAQSRDLRRTGRRSFYLDQTGVLRQNRGPDAAGPNSKELW